VTSLEGKQVVVTRARTQAGPLCEALEATKAVAIRLPTVAIHLDRSAAELDAALLALSTFSWTIFTSANAARAVQARAQAMGVERVVWRGTAVAAIGEATAVALRDAGCDVHLVPDTASTDAIVALLGDVQGRAILLPQSNIARPELALALSSRGAFVHAVVAYHTIPEAPLAPALSHAIAHADAFTFASPSAVTGLQQGLAAIGAPASDCVGVVSIGPSTSAALTGAGFTVQAEAKSASVAGLVQALHLMFGARSPEGALR